MTVECQDCGGYGWFHVHDAGGRLVARLCKPCALAAWCRRVGAARASHSWESWQPVAGLGAHVDALRVWDGDPWAVTLHGGRGGTNYGSGKTHAACAVARSWIEAGRVPVRYYQVAALVQRHRDAISDDTVTVPAVGEVDGLVILDDLGAEAPTPYAAEVVDRIIDQRYGAALPTILTTNLSLDQLDVRYPRVADRLHEGELLEWVAPSWRRR